LNTSSWGKTKKGQPYRKDKSKKIANLKKVEPYKVITVSMYKKNKQNVIEILGTTKKFDTEEKAYAFGEKINKINSKQSGHPKDTDVDIVVVQNKIDALKKVKKLQQKAVDHKPNVIKQYITDGNEYEV